MFKGIAGIDIQDTNGQLRSTYDIIVDLAKVSDTLSSKERQLLFQEAAGTRQVAVLNAIVGNIEDVNKAVDKATASAGSALQENEKFLQGIEGRINTLNSAFQMLSQNTINSGFIKFVVDAATAIVNLIDAMGALPTLLTGLSLFTSFFSGNKLSLLINGLVSSLIGIPSTMGKVIQAFQAGKHAGLGFWGTLSKAGVAGQAAFTGAMLAISAITIALDAYNKGVEEQSRKAKEFVDSWAEAKETLVKNKDAIDDIGTEFERLGKGVDSFGNNISLTSDEFARYHQITNQVADMFPELVSGYDKQGNAILNVKSSVEELNKAYEAQIALENSRVIRGAPTVFDEGERRYSAGTWLDSRTVSGKQLEAQRIYDALVAGQTKIPVAQGLKNVGDVESILSDMGSLASVDAMKRGGTITVSLEDVSSAKQFLASYIRMLEAESASIARDRKSIISAYLFNDSLYQGLDKETKNIVDAVVSNIDDDFVLQQDTLGEMTSSAFATVSTPLLSNDKIIETIKATAKVGDSFRQSEKTVNEYASAYANLQKEMSAAGLGEQAIAAINKTVIDPKVYDPTIESVKKKLIDEFDYKVGSMTLRDLKLVETLQIPDGVLLSWDELQERISESKNRLTSLTLADQVAGLKTAAEVANTAFGESAYYGSLSAEQYKKLVDAGDEYAATVDSTNGYLTVNKQKLDALIASKQEDTRAQIALNKEQKLAEYEKNATQIAAQRDMLDRLTESNGYSADQIKKWSEYLNQSNESLESSQDFLRDEIKAYDVLASELNYATSAYKRWLDAKNSPEAGDGYDELSVARKAIEEGLKSGKTGTNKYKAAEALLIPEEISAQGKEAVAKYVKSMGEYLTEDSSGLQKFIDDLYGKGFLGDSGDGNYYATEKANIQDIAKELNITEDAARLMFAALKDYGATFEIADSAFDTSAAVANIDALQAKLKSAKEELDRLIAAGATVGEVDAARKNVADAESALAGAGGEVTVQLTFEEQLKAKLVALEEAIAAAYNVGIPSHLVLNAETQAAELQTQIDAITSAQAIIATAKAKLDPESLREEIKALENPLNPDGTAKSPIQLAVSAYLTAEYNAAIDSIEALQTTPPSTTLTVAETGADAVGDKIDGIANKQRTATITVDDKALSEAEKRLADLEARLNQKNENPPLREQFGGNSDTQPTPDQILWQYEHGNDKPKEDGEVSLKDLGLPSDTVTIPAVIEPKPDEEAEAKTREIFDTFKANTEKNLSDIRKGYETDELFAVFLSEQIAEMEHLNQTIEGIGLTPTPGDLGRLEAYKEALEAITAPVEVPLSLIDEATSEADKIVESIDKKEATITITTTYEGRGNGFAKGTKRAKKGVALTGEEGVETVIDKDGFYTVGHGGPELVNLKGGEEILNAEETEKLFNRRGGRKFGQSFEGGTDNALKSAWDWLKRAVTKAASPLIEGVQNVAGTVSSVLGGTKTGGKGGKKTPKYDNDSLVDWIPTLLERLRKQTDKIIEQSESLVNYTAQNVKLDEAIALNTKSIEANNSAYARYIRQAETVASNSGLSADIISKIQEGIIDIEAYDEGTRKVISDYEQWYKLAQETLETVSDLGDEQRELAKQKLANVQDYYGNRIDAYGNRIDLGESQISLLQATGREVKATDYAGIISDVQNQLTTLREERAVYDQTFKDLVSSGVIVEGSNEWFEYTQNISEMDKAILEASISLDDFNGVANNIPVDNLKVALKYLDTVQSTIESVQGLREAQGSTLEAIDYERLIVVGMQQIKTLETQNEELRKQQKGLDILSNEYQEIQDQIDGNLSSIWDIKTTQEGWNDAIIDLDIAKLQEVNEQYDRQQRTMEAIESLEKAKQRRALIYREGTGFVYEANQDDIRAAQKEYDDVLFDNLIDTLEGLKKDTNVYDGAGNLIGTPATALDGLNLTPYLNSVLSGAENSALLSNILGQIDMSAISGASKQENSVTFSGDIVLQGVNDVEGLAEAIKVQLPSYISQLWFSNK